MTDQTIESTDTTQTSTKDTDTDSTEETGTDSTEETISKPTESPANTPAGCSHSYKDATCTVPKTCSKCGATEGNAVGHSWNNATCTAPKTCSVCSVTEGTASTEHNWNNATCSTPKTCIICGTTEGTILAHDFYAGECKSCKTADPAMTRIYSKDNLFSLAVPNDVANDPNGYNIRMSEDSYSFIIYTNKGCFGWLMLPVFQFGVSEKGFVDTNDSNLHASNRFGKWTDISTNGKYYVSACVLLEEGIYNPADGDFREPEPEDRQDLENLIAMKDEIFASFRWE